MLLRLFIIFSIFSSLLLSVETVKIGILAKRSAEITLKKYFATAEYLTNEIKGYRFEIVPLSFEELNVSVANNKIDFLLTNTAYYVELEYLYGVSRIATLKNISNDNTVVSSFGGVILTGKNSKIKTLQDLEGKSFAAVNINSFGGWIMAQKELLNHDITMDDFSDFSFLDSHDSVVLAVANGKVDAGTVRTDTLERMINEKVIDKNSFQILSEKNYAGFPFVVSTDLYPEWPFAKLSLTPQELADDVLIALLKMPSSSQAAKDSHINGWTIPLDYSKVHTLLQELDLSFYAQLKEFTFVEFYEKYKLWFFVVSIGFMIILIILFYVSKLNKRLRDAKSQIEELNTGLEIKVQARTVALEKMYTHEKYLKEVLRMIADINELLVSSFSKQTIINESMKILAKHKQYKFAWVGMINKNLLDIIGVSQEDNNILDKKSYSLISIEENSSFQLAKRCMETNQTVISKVNTLSAQKSSLKYWDIAIPLKSNEHDDPIGVLSVYSNSKNGFIDEETKILENLVIDISFALNAITQRTMLEAMEIARTSNYEETILAFVNIIEQRDSYTAGHSIRVAEYCRIIAQEMNIDKRDILKLEKAAILHDIGKVVTPDAILLKPGKLRPLEYELIKQHSAAGYQMLSKIEMYKDLAEIIKFHHVRYDGTGYPQTENMIQEVSMLSYIMVVADAFDAMTSNRIYKSRKSIADAIEEIEICSGTQFHPVVAKAACKALKDVVTKETSQLPSSELEERRFAYFFRDSLTEVYNESYLKLILIKRESDSRCFNLIELKNFSGYNNKYGWNKGNIFLKEFCSTLQKDFPNAMIFRYHGDDFILIFPHHQTIHEEHILSYGVFSDTVVTVKITHYDLKDGMPVF